MIRLFVENPLSGDSLLDLDAGRAHYLANVMRLEAGDPLRVFNGRDGEWAATVAETGKKRCRLHVDGMTRPQPEAQGPWLLMAAIKKPRMAFAVEKATELGAGLVWPVITRHTVMANTNAEKLSLTAIEAAEQCERLDIPGVRPPLPLMDAIGRWPEGRKLALCAETGDARPAMEVFSGWAREPGKPSCGILVGPEGGFAREELERLAALPFVQPIGLGPRILRAETAAVTALALWQAACGDFSAPPRNGER